MRPGTKQFLFVFSLGMLGVLSFLFVDLKAFVALIPLPQGTQVPELNWAFKLLSLIQPSVLVAIATLVGVGLASRVGLHAPAAEAFAYNKPVLPELRPQILPGILGGVVGGLGIVATGFGTRALLPPDAVSRISRLGEILPLPTRFLYGGLTEEVLFRWGLMTLLVWLAWRFLQKRQGDPRGVYFVAAIVLTALTFAAGHLPLAFLIVPNPTALLVVFVIVANSLFGLVAGLLYWKRGLESAMIAHITTHIVLFASSLLGAYF